MGVEASDVSSSERETLISVVRMDNDLFHPANLSSSVNDYECSFLR